MGNKEIESNIDSIHANWIGTYYNSDIERIFTLKIIQVNTSETTVHGILSEIELVGTFENSKLDLTGFKKLYIDNYGIEIYRLFNLTGSIDANNILSGHLEEIISGTKRTAEPNKDSVIITKEEYEWSARKEKNQG